MKKADSLIVYCEHCGHSAGHARLSEGNDRCGRTLKVITLEEWLGKAPHLHLTTAGEEVLAALTTTTEITREDVQRSHELARLHGWD